LASLQYPTSTFGQDPLRSSSSGKRAKENGQRSLGSKEAIKLLPAPGVPFFVEDFFGAYF
jgi:hypothetical protein